MFFLEVGYKIKKKRRGGMSMRKKMKLFIAMVSVGGLIGNYTSYGSGTAGTSNESAGYCKWF